MTFSSKLKGLRIAGLVLVAATSLGACASKSYVDTQMSGVNSRIDALDARVQQASQRADGAASDARTLNQRLDQLEGRVRRLEQMPARTPRG